LSIEMEKLDGMSVNQLKKFADEKKIVIPTGWRKAEIIDEIKLRLDENGNNECPDDGEESELFEESEPETADGLDCDELKTESEPAITDREKNIAVLEKDVAEAAVEMVRAQAKAKAVKKEFDALAERLSDFLNRDNEPSLFDGISERPVCRKCGCVEDGEHFFAADDLCQYCADNLGKEECLVAEVDLETNTIKTDNEPDDEESDELDNL